ncbi:hypothetical protein [Streptomyces achromogenes]|nr:hypothetical protein [Streptomyces achromogenes]
MPGTVLLLAASPRGKGCLVDAASVLPVLAAVPPPVLAGADTANVVELADPLEPQAVLTRLRAAAAAPGPLTLFVAGQLQLDRRQRLPHLALARTTPSTVRYTGFPWHWFREELRLRAAGSTTAVLDLRADPETWQWLRANPLDCGPATAVYGRIAPPPGRREVAAPTYMKAVATILRSGGRPAVERLHQAALTRIAGDGEVGDLVLSGSASPVTPVTPVFPVTPAFPGGPVAPVAPEGGARPASFVVPSASGFPTGAAVPVGPRVPAGSAVPVAPVASVITAGSGAPAAPAVPVGPGAPGLPVGSAAPAVSGTPVGSAAPAVSGTPADSAAANASAGPAAHPVPDVSASASGTPADPAGPAVSASVVPAPARSAYAGPAAPAVPAVAPAPPAVSPAPASAIAPASVAHVGHATPATSSTLRPRIPSPASGGEGEPRGGRERRDLDPHAAISTAVRSGRHADADVLAAGLEQAAAASYGPGSEEALHWAEVRADLAMFAGDAERSCRTWMTVAFARLDAGQPVDAPAVEAAADRAHHQWGRIPDVARARALGRAIAELRARVPGPARGCAGPCPAAVAAAADVPGVNRFSPGPGVSGGRPCTAGPSTGAEPCRWWRPGPRWRR